MHRRFVPLLLLALTAFPLLAADLVRGVRSKLSAGDLASGIAAVEDYRREKGVDEEYLDAVGWLARGAEMQKRVELAQHYVAELRREIPAEKAELLTPFGAAIEVEGRLIAARDGRGAAIRYFEAELAKATAPSLRSRIGKNLNLLSLEGRQAFPIDTSLVIGNAPASLEAYAGKPVILFFWANWCGDCSAQSAALQRVWQKYRERGVGMIAATRFYGTADGKTATPEVERAHVEKIWKEKYPFDGVSTVISTGTMEQYGASATPTFALVDRKGVVRLYTPTRLSEADLSRRLDELLAE